MIGEAVHGELVSWPLRMAVVRGALEQSDKDRVVVMSENAHFYVDSNSEPNALRNSVFPTIMPFCNSKEHLKIMRDFWKLKRKYKDRIAFVGIDVQALDLDFAKPIPEVLRHESTWRQCSADTAARGRVRNRLNAAVIADVISNQSASSKFFYFAHNEHVSKYGCTNSRNDPTYSTEGAILSGEYGFSTLSVGTFAKTIMHMWSGEIERKTRSTLLMNRKTDFDLLYVRAESESENETMHPLDRQTENSQLFRATVNT